jgi:hypothetical protein
LRCWERSARCIVGECLWCWIFPSYIVDVQKHPTTGTSWVFKRNFNCARLLLIGPNIC